MVQLDGDAGQVAEPSPLSRRSCAGRLVDHGGLPPGGVVRRYRHRQKRPSALVRPNADELASGLVAYRHGGHLGRVDDRRTLHRSPGNRPGNPDHPAAGHVFGAVLGQQRSTSRTRPAGSHARWPPVGPSRSAGVTVAVIVTSVLGALHGAPPGRGRRGRRGRRGSGRGRRRRDHGRLRDSCWPATTPAPSSAAATTAAAGGQPDPTPPAPGPGLRPDLAQRAPQHQVVLPAARRGTSPGRHRLQEGRRLAQLRPLPPAGRAVGQVLLDGPRLGTTEQAQRVCAQLTGVVHAVHACTSRCMVARSARRA